MANPVSRWLDQLGLGQYAAAFGENAIDMEMLPNMDHDLLKELGVVVIGHRIRILDAAANLIPGSESRGQDTGKQIENDDAERRQLTVMFCDLADSTELTQQHDAEDVRIINLAYQDTCKQIIEKYGGYIARYMGDGILAYFGYPQAHEDDAERAVHAGLQMGAEIPELEVKLNEQAEVRLCVRVGIETGVVVVGDLIGEGASQESAVVGETPNLAARLQSIATRNTVVIGPGAKQLVTANFKFRDLGDQTLKGIRSPVPAWQVTGEARAGSRFEIAHQSNLTPLVGRSQEIGLIRERWEQACEGDGQVVLLSGEAGIGKSRISETLRENISGGENTTLRYQCSPHHINSALYPVIEQLRRAVGIRSDSSTADRFACLQNWVRSLVPDSAQVLPLLSRLLSIPVSHEYQMPSTSPERIKELTLEALSEVVESASSNHPLLIIFEDVHWADPSSLDWLDSVISRIQHNNILAIITFRPEFGSRWENHTHITSLTLNRLTRKLASSMVDGIETAQSLPDKVKQLIIEKADGMPLFVEELTKTILESNHGMSPESDASIDIPTTLQDSLMARLDRLTRGKTVAQTGAVIGRSFSIELLELASGLDQPGLDEALEELIESGLVFRSGENLVFKHALVQEAAYASLLKSRQRSLHALIAEALRDRFPETEESQPELLAYHFQNAGQQQQAVDYWLLAGRRARERSADQEAVGHLTAGITILRDLPDSDDNAMMELEFLLDLCGPAIVATGWGSKLSAETYTRARELCSRLGATEKIAPVLYGEYMLELTAGRINGTRNKAVELLELGEQQQSVEAIMAGHRTVAWSSLYLGDFSRSWRHVTQVRDFYRAEEHQEQKYRYAHDPLVASLCAQSILESLFGKLEQSAQTTAEALEFARSTDHVSTLIYALMFAGALPAIVQQDASRVENYSGEICDLSGQIGSNVWIGFGKVVSGWCLGKGGSYGKGASELEHGLKILDGSAPHPWRPLFLSMLADVHLGQGELERAVTPLELARSMIEDTDERMWESGVTLLLGEAAEQRQDVDAREAEHLLFRALDIAARQGAKLLELRAAIRLVELWQCRGNPKQSEGLLRPVIEKFPQDYSFPLLERARGYL